jgi:putative ABC transport system ATP-binding protein
MNSHSITPLERIKQLITFEKKDILLLLVLTITYGLLGISIPVAVQALVNTVTMGSVLQPLYIVGLILLLLLLISGAIYVIENYLVELIQRRMFVNTAIEVANNMKNIDISVYDKENPVELMNRFFDITTAQKSIATLLTTGLSALLQGLIGCLILMMYSVYFVIPTFIIAIILFITISIIGRRAEASAILESKAKYQMAEWLENIAQNGKLFKFYNAANRVLMGTDSKAMHFLTKRMNHFRLLQFQIIIAVCMYAFVGTSMLVLGGSLVIQGQINLGQFVAAELIIFGVLSAFVVFITKLESFYDLLAAKDKLGVLEDITQESASNTHAVKLDYINELITKDLIYPLHGNPNATVRPPNIHLKKGDSLALLGNSGAGKSIFIDMLIGLRQPLSGTITYNNTDIQFLDKASFRDQIGLAGNIGITNASILDNILLGRNHVSHDYLKEVLIKLSLNNEFNQLPKGLETQLTVLGSPLSNTQIDRLELARALVGQPQLLIIDGILDSLTQKELDDVLELINKTQAQMITIISTRKLSIANRMQTQLDVSYKS